MLSHQQIKLVNSLKIKKYRQLHQAFIVEGEKGVAELLEADLVTQKLFATSGWLHANQSLLRGKPSEITEITNDELKKISDLATPNRVLAVAAIPGRQIPLPGQSSSPLMLMLDGVRDPGNLGTIVRTADWFGVDTIICSSDTVDFYNPKVIQATMGSFGRVQVHFTDLAAYLKGLAGQVPVLGAVLGGSDITQQKFSKNCIVVLGSESHGIRNELMPYITDPVSIPRWRSGSSASMTESLNVSIANGIICYEICKQLMA